MLRRNYLAPILVLAVAPLFGQSADTPTSVLDQKPSDLINRELPYWIRLGGQQRLRFEGLYPGSYAAGKDYYLLYRTRIDLTIKPFHWLTLFGQGQDARIYMEDRAKPAPPYKVSWGLRQAYVGLGNLENGRVSMIVGRQEINLGDQRLVGSSDWGNAARSFDAVRLRLRSKAYRLDAFSASVVNHVAAGFEHHTPGNNIHGLYGGLDRLVPGATVEPYLLWRVAPVSLSPTSEVGPPGKLNQKTIGVRLNGKWAHGFDYNVEMAKQFGRVGQDGISAWAGHWLVGKAFSSVWSKPRWVLEYNYASGDENRVDGTRGTFDQIYPTAHAKYGYSDAVGWRNIRDAHTALELKLTKRWSAGMGFHDYWLANRHDGLYDASSALVARSPNGTAGTHVGVGLDAFGSYDLSQTLKLGAGYGRLFTGEFLNRTTNGNDLDYPYIVITWTL